uniref:Uncharacterized protein n=1 Tax=viral metagenome TaxID=1070528 RepID=A0A6M3XM04_9ZZZZ
MLTIYDTVPMQMFFITSIKTPFEEGILTLTSKDANKIEKFKAARKLYGALKAIEAIPEPTKENTTCPNTHIIIDAREWYFSHFYHEQDRARLMRQIFNFVIILYHYDLPWRLKIDKVFEFIQTQPWILPDYIDKLKDIWTWYREDDSKPFPWGDYDPSTIGR